MALTHIALPRAEPSRYPNYVSPRPTAECWRATPDVPSGNTADPALRAIPWEETAQDFEL